MSSQSLYDVLGVLESASDEDIKAAYRRKMKLIHPDRGGSEEAAKQLNVAYETLSDPVSRASYDRSRRSQAMVCFMCDAPVSSDDELMAHVVRHRAEVEAAQQVVRAEAQKTAREEQERKAREHRATAQASSRGPGRTKPSSEANAASGGNQEPSASSRWSEQGRGAEASKGSGENRNMVRTLTGVVVISFIVAVSLGGYMISSNQSSASDSAPAETFAAAEKPSAEVAASTISSTTTSTTTTSSAPMAPTWVLEEFNGSWYIDGSVTPTSTGVLLGYQDSSQDLYLTIDGAPKYNVQTWSCLTEECDTSLSLMINTPSELIWALDARQPNGEYEFSDLLHHEISTSGEDLAACWSRSYGGPIVAVMTGSTVSRAWVLADADAGGSWLGVDTSTFDAARMVPALEFAGEVLSTC